MMTKKPPGSTSIPQKQNSEPSARATAGEPLVRLGYHFDQCRVGVMMALRHMRRQLHTGCKGMMFMTISGTYITPTGEWPCAAVV